MEETTTQQPATTLPAKTLCCSRSPVILWWDRTFSLSPSEIRSLQTKYHRLGNDDISKSSDVKVWTHPIVFPRKVKSKMCTIEVLPLKTPKQTILCRWRLLYETMNLSHHVALKAKQYRSLQGSWHPWVMAKLLWNHPTLSLQVPCSHSL